jgi:hypothetical protein
MKLGLVPMPSSHTLIAAGWDHADAFFNALDLDLEAQYEIQVASRTSIKKGKGKGKGKVKSLPPRFVDTLECRVLQTFIRLFQKYWPTMRSIGRTFRDREREAWRAHCAAHKNSGPILDLVLALRSCKKLRELHFGPDGHSCLVDIETAVMTRDYAVLASCSDYVQNEINLARIRMRSDRRKKERLLAKNRAKAGLLQVSEAAGGLAMLKARYSDDVKAATTILLGQLYKLDEADQRNEVAKLAKAMQLKVMDAWGVEEIKEKIEECLWMEW